MSPKTRLWLIVWMMKARTKHKNKQVLEGAKEIKGTTPPKVSPNVQDPTSKGTTEQKQNSKSKQSNLKLRYG